MAETDESLLDVFVNIKPDPDFLAAVNQSADAAIAAYAQKFSQANIPMPTIAPPGGGGGRGGRSAGGGIADEFREASRAVEDLQRNLRVASREMRSAGIFTFDDEIKRLQDQLSDLMLNVRRQTQDFDGTDLLGIQQSLQYIGPLRDQINRLFQDISSRRPLSEEFEALKRGGASLIAEGRISSRLQGSLIRGLPSADLRTQLAQEGAQVELMEKKVRDLSLAFDGTQDSVDRLRAAIGNLHAAQQVVGDLQQKAQQTSSSMNTLTNNAYQLGQAFEDFAVGFSLNGLAGGIRGAANNVAFLLNDLSRFPGVQAKIGENFARYLPLIAGIGSALAITVLPLLVEWLESLNDIETQTKDITEELKRAAAETDFDIKIGQDERSFARAIDQAKTVREILDKIQELAVKAEDRRIDIGKIFEGLESSGSLKKAQDSIGEASGLITTKLNELLEARQKLQSSFESFHGEGVNIEPALIDSEFSGKSIENVQKVQAEIGELAQLIELANKNASKGLFTKEQLEDTEKKMFSIRTSIEEMSKSIDLGDEDFGKAFADNLGVIQDRITKAREAAEDFNSLVGEQLQKGIDGHLSKTAELADQQLILRREIEGTVGGNAKFLLDVKETSAAYADLINKVAKFYSDQGKDPSVLVNQLQSQEIFRSENDVLSQQKTTIEEIREAEEKLESLRKGNADKEKNRRSQFMDLESFAKSLQTNVLKIDPIDKNTEAIDKLTEKLEELNFDLAQEQATAENLKSQFSDPQGFARRQREIAFARPFDEAQALQQLFDPTGVGRAAMMAEDAIRIQEAMPQGIANAVEAGVRRALEGFGAPMVNEQKNTVNAVKGLNLGARAQ